MGGILGAVASQDPVEPLQEMLWIGDLSTIAPACLAGGILLLRRRPLGYTGGTGLLLAYSLLFFGLVWVMVFPAIYDGTPVDAVGLGMMVGMGTLSLVLLALFLRGTTSGGSSSG